MRQKNTRRLNVRGDRSEARSLGLGQDLAPALLGAGVAKLAAHAHHLGHELDQESLVARRARGAARRLPAHGLAVTVVGAIEGESPAALLHLVPQLHSQTP